VYTKKKYFLPNVVLAVILWSPGTPLALLVESGTAAANYSKEDEDDDDGDPDWGSPAIVDRNSL
jgi:hypothetical protein